jgi:hypothetical protein
MQSINQVSIQSDDSSLSINSIQRFQNTKARNGTIEVGRYFAILIHKRRQTLGLMYIDGRYGPRVKQSNDINQLTNRA